MTSSQRGLYGFQADALAGAEDEDVGHERLLDVVTGHQSPWRDAAPCGCLTGFLLVNDQPCRVFRRSRPPGRRLLAAEYPHADG